MCSSLACFMCSSLACVVCNSSATARPSVAAGASRPRGSHRSPEQIVPWYGPRNKTLLHKQSRHAHIYMVHIYTPPLPRRLCRLYLLLNTTTTTATTTTTTTTTNHNHYQYSTDNHSNTRHCNKSRSQCMLHMFLAILSNIGIKLMRTMLMIYVHIPRYLTGPRSGGAKKVKAFVYLLCFKFGARKSAKNILKCT